MFVISVHKMARDFEVEVIKLAFIFIGIMWSHYLNCV